MQSYERALVIGASSGIGRAIAEQLLKEGTRVALVARRQAPLEDIAASYSGRAFVYPHDVTDYAKAPALFQQITHDLGGLDLIVYASGVMPAIEENEYSFEKDREMIEVNLLGAIAWLNESAKRFERTKGGTIVGISSVAGERGRRGNPAYGASKAALSSFLESLRNRLSRYGVHVVTIKPGFIDTEMVRGKPGLFWVISAEKAATQILHAAKRASSTMLGTNIAYIPARWRFVTGALKCIPSFVFRRLPI
ncbi:MAG TPA: SDR family NAD(P)-dependent oxidoreductase [Candidatus Kapabacteria bacterium]|nr:SDR family NAD(P)-dependent oxidoreductase [Candidatus Kapabacteria bacterium]